MRAETASVLAGVAVAVLLVVGRAVLLPEPPSPMSGPGAESLEGLSRYLAADAAPPAGETAGTVRLARDPFGRGGVPEYADPSAGSPAATPKRWSVSAIMISEDRRLAIIDDRLVEAGDSVAGGGRVLAVARDHVVVLGPDGIRRRIALNR